MTLDEMLAEARNREMYVIPSWTMTRCDWCGTFQPCEPTPAHVGGKGSVVVWLCRDRAPCERRQAGRRREQGTLVEAVR